MQSILILKMQLVTFITEKNNCHNCQHDHYFLAEIQESIYEKILTALDSPTAPNAICKNPSLPIKEPIGLSGWHTP